MRNGQPVVRFHVMAKPVGPLCNLDCSYCFYLHKKELLDTPSAWKMSDEELESFIRQYITGQNWSEAIFTWQGGEPTLAGLDFFERVVALQKKHARGDMRVENDLQTNGTLLDDAWCAFLAKNRFLVGLSCDGPRELHDASRAHPGGRGTHAEVVRAARLLKKHGVPFNALACVHRRNAGFPLDVYRFLTRELGATRIQFIPVVEPRTYTATAPQHWPPHALPRQGEPRALPGAPDSFVHEWSVEPRPWGEFLCKVFEDWRRRDTGKVFVPLFATALKQLRGEVSDLCSLAPICGKALALEHNGDLYSCDHYVYPEYRLGNILQTDLANLWLSPRQEAFGYAKDTFLPSPCRQCKHLWLCAGECPKNRFLKTSAGEAGLNYLCEGWKIWFDYIQSRPA